MIHDKLQVENTGHFFQFRWKKKFRFPTEVNMQVKNVRNCYYRHYVIKIKRWIEKTRICSVLNLIPAFLYEMA